MKKDIFAVLFLLFGLFNFPAAGFTETRPQKAVLIIAHQDFRDEELLLTQNMLQINRVNVVLASSSLLPARGMLGSVVRPDILLGDIQIKDYDALVFIGGSGAKDFWDEPLAQDLARQADSQGKIIGAICLAPVILAKAGILANREATVWPGAAQELKECAVRYTGQTLQIDKNIITANGPEASSEFADALAAALVRRR